MRGKSVLTLAVMVVLCLVSLMPAAAQNSEPVVVPDVTQGEQLLHENFNKANAWEKYAPDNGVDFGVSGGVYSMHVPKSMGSSIIWAVNATEHTDVIIDATFIQRTENAKSEFGLMCRANTSGTGYYFIISGDGTGYIAKGLSDRNLDLTDRVSSSAIVTGTDANTVRAICAGNYLALYVNDTLVAQANDSDYASGVAGLAAASGGDLDADVTVDDLDIYQANVGAPIATQVQPTNEPTQPSVVTPIAYTSGASLLHETFKTRNAWENYTTDSGVKFGVATNAYNMHIPSSIANVFFWGNNKATQTDVIIDATMSQKSDNPQAQYGVICRSDDKGQGYYFVVGMDGYAFIAKGTPGKVDDLTDEVQTSAINTGTDSNTVRAVCIGNYLALYVNDQFIVDANDSTFTSGVAGLTAATATAQDADVIVKSVDISEALVGVPTQTTDTANLPQLDGVSVGKVLLTEPFDSPDAWETYDSSDDVAHFKVENGEYVATLSQKGLFYSGLNTTVNNNYVITVDTTLKNGPINDAQGVICRAAEDASGAGYYFRVSGDGYASIMRFDKDATKLVTLVDWTESSAIRQGNATNTLTAVCVDDYLGFYVNGTKVAEAHDSTYVKGVTGLVVTEYDEGSLKVTFDNLTLYNAKLS